MKVITQHFFGTTREWKVENPILYNAVWGFEKTRDGKVLAKLGDGETPWNLLKYFDKDNIKGLSEELNSILEKAIEANQKDGFSGTPGFFRLYVNDDGDLILQTNEGTENPLRYDDNTGDLYYQVGENEFFVGNIRCKQCNCVTEETEETTD